MHLYLTDTIIGAVVGVLLGGVAVIVVIIIVVLLIHLFKKRTCRLPWTHFAVYDVICYMLFVTLTATKKKTNGQQDGSAK